MKQSCILLSCSVLRIQTNNTKIYDYPLSLVTVFWGHLSPSLFSCMIKIVVFLTTNYTSASLGMELGWPKEYCSFTNISCLVVVWYCILLHPGPVQIEMYWDILDSVELQSGVLLWSSTDASVVDVLRYFGLCRTPLWSSTDASVELLQMHYNHVIFLMLNLWKSIKNYQNFKMSTIWMKYSEVSNFLD